MNKFYVVQDWMIHDLKLKGLEKDLYAIIYGYSQDGESKFYGSLNYLARLTGYSRQSVITSLKKLTDSGLIVKQEFKLNNNICYKYYAEDLTLLGCKETLQGCKESLQVGCKESLQGCKESLPNNIDNNKINNKLLFKNNNLIKKQKPANLYDKCVNLINDYCNNQNILTHEPNLKKALIQYLNLRLEMKDKPIYTNQWKGLLNKLEDIFQLDSNPNDLRTDIVNQSIEKGYASFYPVNQYNRKNSNIHWQDEYNESEEQYEQQQEKF